MPEMNMNSVTKLAVLLTLVLRLVYPQGLYDNSPYDNL